MHSASKISDSKASDVISLVKQLRAVNGLPPYLLNQVLMNVSQAHSNFQAADMAISYASASGSSPKDRAIAVEYSGGAAVFVFENIVGGGGISSVAILQARPRRDCDPYPTRGDTRTNIHHNDRTSRRK